MADELTDEATELLQDLIRCKSVTPAEGGALTYLENLLSTPALPIEVMIVHADSVLVFSSPIA